MTRGSDCPECGRDIGMWPIIKATRPNRFYCPHCGALVWYRGAGWVIAGFTVLLVVLVLASLVAGWAVAGFEEPGLAMLAALAVLVLSFIPFELAYALVLRSGYQLESANAPQYDWEDEPF